MNPVTQSIDTLLVNPKHVIINPTKVSSLAEKLSRTELKHWSQESPIDLSDLTKEEAIAFKFVFNSISFSYWGEPQWHSPANLERGTWNLIHALYTAGKEGIPILDPEFLMDLEKQDLQHILRGNITIPLFEERLRILREIGEVTKAKYDGNFSAIIEESDYDALKLVDLLTTNFSSFNDSSIYKGKNVHFHKRAQLLVSDLAYEDEKITGVEELTACADYILPMVLRHQGAIELSSELARKVDNKIPLDENSAEVNEVRMTTIKCVEEIARKSQYTAMQVNDYLWTAAPTIPQAVEYLRVRTTRF